MASSNRFTINDSPTEEELAVIKRGLKEYNKQFPHGNLDVPENDICLVLKDNKDCVVGGVITSMLFGVLHLETLWIDESYRGLGYGRDLVLEAEKKGREKGYTAASTWTFSFQAPEFYQSIGYRLLGTFEGYVEGITEHVLMKKLDKDSLLHDRISDSENDRLVVSEDSSEEALAVLHKGLGEYVSRHVAEIRKKIPEVVINLVVKTDNGKVIGGIIAGTTLGTMYIEHLWVDETYRGQGYGKDLLIEAERIAKENGCISGQTWVPSFQAHGFFRKHGYEVFGFSDGYPDDIEEYYFIKKF
jgi:ribosomal protein S18 acetylase RimI-like enzyme